VLNPILAPPVFLVAAHPPAVSSVWKHPTVAIRKQAPASVNLGSTALDEILNKRELALVRRVSVAAINTDEVLLELLEA
jgi:hypothetical protein